MRAFVFAFRLHLCPEMYAVTKLVDFTKFRQTERTFVDLTILENFSKLCQSHQPWRNFVRFVTLAKFVNFTGPLNQVIAIHSYNFVNSFDEILLDLHYLQNFHRFTNFVTSVNIDNIVNKILSNLPFSLPRAFLNISQILSFITTQRSTSLIQLSRFSVPFTTNLVTTSCSCILIPIRFYL